MYHRIKTTKPQQFIDITRKVIEEIKKSKVEDGIAIIHVPHTTAGITINENADPDVVRDMITALDKTYHVYGDYHLKEILMPYKASLMGSSCGHNQDGNHIGYPARDLLLRIDGPRVLHGL